MELRHLRYFAAVAEEENVSRAALKLHVSQPALSRQVRDLEDELGFPLLRRSAKSVRLTEAGRVFFAEARAVLGRVEEAVQAARSAALGDNAELHIGYAMSPTVRMLPQALRAFQSEMPRVRVKLHDLSTEEMLSGLREGKLQLAFMVFANPGMLRGLGVEKLAGLPVRLAVAPGHPLARSKAVKLEEVARHSLIAFARAEYPDYHELLSQWFAVAGAKPVISGELDSVSSLIAAVEAGEGVALVTESMACVAGSRLKLLRVTPEPSPLVIAAVWPESGLSVAAKAFLSCARNADSNRETCQKGRQEPK